MTHDPLHYKAYCNVGSIYRNLEKYYEAISSYQKALSIKKDDYKAVYNLANIYRIIGDPERAIPGYT